MDALGGVRMEFRVFRNPEPKPVDDGPKTFGRRQGFIEAARERMTAGRLVKALLLGLGLGLLGLMFAPAL